LSGFSNNLLLGTARASVGGDKNNS